MLKNIIVYFVCIAFLFQSVAAFAATNLTYTYDANGNLTQGDGKYFEYNDANKLVRVRMGSASGPVVAEFFYDHSGQRIKKIENGVVTYYAGKHFDKVVNGDSPGETMYYFAGVQRVSKKYQDGKRTYFHLDHLGSTNAVTNSSGSVMERIIHYPFGDIREGGSERYTFTGKEKDHVSDLYYFEARHFNSNNRHFTQADSKIPEYYSPQSLNRYSYAVNNPLKYVDPSGNMYQYAFLFVAAAAAYLTTESIYDVLVLIKDQYDVMKLESEIEVINKKLNNVHPYGYPNEKFYEGKEREALEIELIKKEVELEAEKDDQAQNVNLAMIPGAPANIHKLPRAFESIGVDIFSNIFYNSLHSQTTEEKIKEKTDEYYRKKNVKSIKKSSQDKYDISKPNQVFNPIPAKTEENRSSASGCMCTDQGYFCP